MVLVDAGGKARDNAVNIERIHHVAIICADYERSKRFYVELLGFEIIEETYRAERDSYKLDLMVGERDRIELFSFPNPPERVNRPEARGLRHLAFQVANVEKATEELKRQGVEVEPVRIDEVTGKKFSFISDPDGLPLEIYEG